MKLSTSVRRAVAAGFAVEDTGGGCQWLRRGQIVITDGDAGLPVGNESVMMFTLEADGDYDDGGREFGSLDAALAFLSSSERIYGKQ